MNTRHTRNMNAPSYRGMQVQGENKDVSSTVCIHYRPCFGVPLRNGSSQTLEDNAPSTSSARATERTCIMHYVQSGGEALGSLLPTSVTRQVLHLLQTLSDMKRPCQECMQHLTLWVFRGSVPPVQSMIGNRCLLLKKRVFHAFPLP